MKNSSKFISKISLYIKDSDFDDVSPKMLLFSDYSLLILYIYISYLFLFFSFGRRGSQSEEVP